LYCRQPLSVLMLGEGLNFILTCKPDSHKILYEWLNELEAMDAIHKQWLLSAGQERPVRLIRIDLLTKSLCVMVTMPWK